MPSSRSTTAAVLSRRDWLAAVARCLRTELPEDRATFTPTVAFSLLKIAYDNPKVHYEVGPDTSRGHLELALHFEDGPVSTAAYLRWFDREIVALKHDLGIALELERWTSSWGRLYELHPLPRFDAPSAIDTAERLATLIETLQPMVEAAAVPPERR
jgi:hypothetical protein